MKTSSSLNGLLGFFKSESLPIPGRPGLEAQILDAARRCLIQYSADKLSMNDVARIAGVSRGSVYNYFPHRQALIDAVMELGVDLAFEDIERAMASQDTLEEQVAAAAVVIRQWHEAEAAARLLLPREEALQLARETGKIMRRMMDLVSKYADQARSRGEVRPDLDLDPAAEWVARVLYSLLVVPPETFGNTTRGLKDFVRAHVVRGLS